MELKRKELQEVIWGLHSARGQLYEDMNDMGLSEKERDMSREMANRFAKYEASLEKVIREAEVEGLARITVY